MADADGMKQQSNTQSIPARLSKVALSLESGAGEASLIFDAAEHINSLESRLKRAQEIVLYLRSTLDDVAALLAGEQIDPARHIADTDAEAAIKSRAAVRVAAKFDLAG
jgi:hypothetical protein